jgi:DNA topoisomerase-1
VLKEEYTKDELAELKKKDKEPKKFEKKFPSSKEKTEEYIKKTKEKISAEKKNLEKKENNKDIALGTSKTNYNDPRISVAWCKKWEVPIEKVFSKTLRSKFVWAMYEEPDFDF